MSVMKEIEYNKCLMLRLGFNASSKGFNYWLVAIQLFNENQNHNFKIEDIYNEIAFLYDTKRDNVERCMRTSLQPAKEKIKEYFGYDYKISTKTFLELMKGVRI